MRGEPTVEWIDFELATWVQLEAHEKLLSESIARDVASRRNFRRLMKFFRPLMEPFPERTVREATDVHKRSK